MTLVQDQVSFLVIPTQCSLHKESCSPEQACLLLPWHFSKVEDCGHPFPLPVQQLTTKLRPSEVMTDMVAAEDGIL